MLLEGIGILRESSNKQNRLHGSRRCVSARIKNVQNMFLILGHFEKTRMFFQSAFASNKRVSFPLVFRCRKQSLQKIDFRGFY